MEVIQAYYDGSVFVPLAPVNVKVNQPAIIIMNTMKTNLNNNSYSELFGALSPGSYSGIMEALSDTEIADEW